MAVKSLHIPGIGTFTYDDKGGTEALTTDGVLQVSNTPTNPDDVLRKADVPSIAAPADAPFVVVSLTGDLSAERQLAVGTGLTLTDGGADGNITIGVDEANIDHNALQNYVANEHIDWTNATETLKTSGSVQVGATGAIYFGDSATDGTWRITRSGNNLVFQRREAGVWNTKSTITP